MIVGTDKNLGLALIDRDEYDRLCQQHLTDATTYRLISNTPNITIDENTKALLRQLNIAARRLRPDIVKLTEFLDQHQTHFRIPKFHCLLKIHKTPVAGRPIAGAHSWITTEISKFLSFLLRPKVERMKAVVLRDTQQLIAELEHKPISDNSLFFTMDIVALYPNMDHAKTLAAVAALRFENPNERNWCLNATEAILKCSLVEYNQKIFIQTRGMPMGTNAAVELANIYVATVIELNPRFREHNGRLTHYKRFIDDVFGIWRGTVVEFERWVSTLNSIDPSIKFTSTIHPEHVNFLDVTVFNHNNTIAFRSFQKPQNKFLYIPFDSTHPPHCFKGFIKAELSRHLRNNTLRPDFTHIKQEFFVRLENRGYPIRNLLRWFNQITFDQRLRAAILDPPNNPEQAPLPVIPLVVPYHPRIAEIPFARLLKTFWADHPELNHLRPLVAYQKMRNLTTMFTTSNFSARPLALRPHVPLEVPKRFLSTPVTFRFSHVIHQFTRHAWTPDTRFLPPPGPPLPAIETPPPSLNTPNPLNTNSPNPNPDRPHRKRSLTTRTTSNPTNKRPRRHPA
jgi:hypothetical protein